MNNKVIVFDFDGTLVDTLEGIYNAVNLTIKDLNLPFSYTKKEVMSFIGKGALNLFKKFIQKEELNNEDIKNYNEIFLSHYKNEQIISKPYKNVISILNELKLKGYKLIVFSNKPHNLLMTICDAIFGENYFLKVQGNDNIQKLKPDASFLLNFFNSNELVCKGGYFVGDSLVDMETAKNADLESIFCTYGYENMNITNLNANYKINSFEEILNIVK